MSTKAIHIFASINEIAEFFADLLSKEMAKLTSGELFSLALSGGSTPKAIFEYLSQHKQNFAWEYLQLFWGDERCVPPDHPDSNYNMAKKSLLDHVTIPPGNIFRIKGEFDPGDEALRYAEIVKSRLTTENNLPRFDMVMLGMGDDGHTASLFPGNINAFYSGNLFEKVSHPISGQRRITVTLELINNAKNIVFLVTGDAKASMLARIHEKNTGWETFPASLVEATNGNVFWLADKAAASKLRI